MFIKIGKWSVISQSKIPHSCGMKSLIQIWSKRDGISFEIGENLTAFAIRGIKWFECSKLTNSMHGWSSLSKQIFRSSKKTHVLLEVKVFF